MAPTGRAVPRPKGDEQARRGRQPREGDGCCRSEAWRGSVIEMSAIAKCLQHHRGENGFQVRLRPRRELLFDRILRIAKPNVGFDVLDKLNLIEPNIAEKKKNQKKKPKKPHKKTDFEQVGFWILHK
jgi:hypothetical protein